MGTTNEELGARLAVWHGALRSMGRLRATSSRAWWRTEPERTTTWWLRGVAPYGTNDPRDVHFRGGAEGIALLNTLARVDSAAFIREIQRVRSPTGSGLSSSETVVRPEVSCSEIGFSYRIYRPDDIDPVCERIAGVDPPSEAFLNDYMYLTTAFHAVEGKLEPIPVHLHVWLRGDRAADLANVLRRLVDSIVDAQHQGQNVDVCAITRSRFKIVEVELDKVSSVPLNVKSLEYLAKLAQLGVRVRYLPAIHVHDTASQDPRSVVNTLQALIRPTLASVSWVSSPQVKYVQLNERSSSRIIPAVFSALQASRDIETVSMEVPYDPTDDMDEMDDMPDPNAAMTMWKWAAYALFGYHACPSLKKIVVNVTYLNHGIINEVENIIEAGDPIAALFGTTVEEYGISGADSDESESDSEEEKPWWIWAARFHLRDPAIDEYSDNSSPYDTEAPLRVRVVDFVELGDNRWWRVVLPGCGHAWVNSTDATAVSQEDDELTATTEAAQLSKPPLHLRFEEVDELSCAAILRLLRMLPRDVASIEIQTCEYGFHGDGFDITYWVEEVLRLFFNLERIEFNCFAIVPRLSIFVEAALAGHARLRSMSLGNTFYADSTDILEYLAVLSDNEHPLTSRLEELEITVSAQEDTPFQNFKSTWRTLLQRNRKLHTIKLFLFAPECVEEYDFYGIPLTMDMKLAFLSTLRHEDNGERARNRLDSSVISTIFDFAAQPRTVVIDFDN